MHNKELLNLMMTISPLTDSLVSRTKKSMFGPPMPMLTMETGTPLYRPVMVKKPLSDASLNGSGLLSNRAARASARDGLPTVA